LISTIFLFTNPPTLICFVFLLLYWAYWVTFTSSYNILLNSPSPAFAFIPSPPFLE
jgi:hypothetical protein